MCVAFSTSEISVSIGVALVSTAFLVLQLLVRPYRKVWVNRLAFCAALCLVIFNICSSLTAAFMSFGVDARQSDVYAFSERLKLGMFFSLLPAPALCASEWC